MLLLGTVQKREDISAWCMRTCLRSATCVYVLKALSLDADLARTSVLCNRTSKLLIVSAQQDPHHLLPVRSCHPSQATVQALLNGLWSSDSPVVAEVSTSNTAGPLLGLLLQCSAAASTDETASSSIQPNNMLTSSTLQLPELYVNLFVFTNFLSCLK
jgi:hypothetical protein